MILARGPAKVTTALAWSLRSDTVEVGAPIHARIYERKCDLSPNGAFLLYAAFGKGPDLPFHGSGYTVICEPPSLTALTFLDMGTTYGGGGLFLSDSEVYVPLAGCAPCHREDRRFRMSGGPPPDAPPPALRELSFSTIHYRLLRDGWTMAGEDYEKTAGRRRLIKSFTERSETHLLADTRTGDVEDGADWEWADFDGDDLLYARRGRIMRRTADGEAREVADISGIIAA